MKRRLLAALLALGFVAVACETDQTPPAPVPPTRESPEPMPTGAGTAAEALAELCPGKTGGNPKEVQPDGPPPPEIAEVMREVEEVRGLEFRERVVADPVTQEVLAQRLQRHYQRELPDEYLERKSLAWATIGAIPEGASIKDALREFAGGQVAGYYVPASGKLVFIGGEELDAEAHVILAHELTHAVDDQHFDLDRLDRLGERCSDDAYDAAVAVVEGSAQRFSLEVARRFLSADERLSLADIDVPPLGDVPPFIVQIQFWPYTAGFAFVSAREGRGGLEEVNTAIEDLPVSTEQIIHPDRYPNDAPQAVDVPDLGPRLGQGFHDLDVQGVGEEWLQLLLGLRLDSDGARDGAAGWDGGLYRAWSDGGAVAIAMATVWDRPLDAREFAEAMQGWIDEGDGDAFVRASGDRVTVGFASDEGTLIRLRAAL